MLSMFHRLVPFSSQNTPTWDILITICTTKGRELRLRLWKSVTHNMQDPRSPGSRVLHLPISDPRGHWSLGEMGRSCQEGSRNREPREMKPTGAPSQFCLEAALFEVEPCSHYVAIDYLPFCIVEMYPPLSRLILLTVECCTQTLQWQTTNSIFSASTMLLLTSLQFLPYSFWCRALHIHHSYSFLQCLWGKVIETHWGKGERAERNKTVPQCNTKHHKKNKEKQIDTRWLIIW